MHGEEGTVQLTTKMLVTRLLTLLGVSLAVGFVGAETIFLLFRRQLAGFL